MYCKKCGAVLPDDALFCQRCGTQQRGVGSQSWTPSPANHHEAQPHAFAQVVYIFIAMFGFFFRLTATVAVVYFIVGSIAWGPGTAWDNLTSLVADRTSGIQNRIGAGGGNPVDSTASRTTGSAPTAVEQRVGNHADCDGFDAWYSAMAQRMTEMSDKGMTVLSGELYTVNEAELVARQIDGIAESQRDSTPPPAASTLNALLVESAELSAKRIRAAIGQDVSTVTRLDAQLRGLADPVGQEDERLRERCE